MKKYLLIIFTTVSLVTLSFGSFALAAVAPTLFTYNDSTKECGTYRDGDEYVRYDLPSDWQTYDYQTSTAKTTQEYCDELGYKNIGSVTDYLKLPMITIMERPSNLTSSSNTYPLFAILVILILLAMVVGIIVIIKNKNSKKL
jgi:hypothetical protein